MTNFFRFLVSKTFWINIGIAILVIILLIWVSLQALKVYTNHNESVSVPDIKGMTVEQASAMLQRANLEHSVADSSYSSAKQPGEVLEQNPKPASKVKENRTIYLTINAQSAPQVKLPELKDVSLRQARLILESKGLKVGELEYVPDLAENAVLRLKVNGREVKAGTMLRKGTVVDLVLGSGLSNTKVTVPPLEGLTMDAVEMMLITYSLNLGAAIYDTTVTDTASAVVYRQSPPANREARMGEAVDIFLTQQLKNSKKDTTSNGQ